MIMQIKALETYSNRVLKESVFLFYKVGMKPLNTQNKETVLCLFLYFMCFKGFIPTLTDCCGPLGAMQPSCKHIRDDFFHLS